MDDSLVAWIGKIAERNRWTEIAFIREEKRRKDYIMKYVLTFMKPE